MKRWKMLLRAAAQAATAAALVFIAVSCGGGTPGNVKSDKAVQEVMSGARTEANAAWWGFDETDATDALQAAIDSGAGRVIVPNMGRDWIVRPIMLADDQEVFFEEGVVLTAKKGEYKGGNDSLLNAYEKKNIRLVGYGATLRMQKDDYMTDAYKKAEWRMVINVRSCTNMDILGLTLKDSGGDGIYLGVSGEQLYNKDITIRDVVCDNNYRQGISVISADGLLIEDCAFNNTWGTPPEAGIDLEPNHPEEFLKDCVIRNCVFENNRGFGIASYTNPLSAESADMSVLFENCRVTSDKGAGIYAGAVRDDGPLGIIEFRGCSVENVAKWGLMISDKSADRAVVRFSDCVWRGTATMEDLENGVPMLLRGRENRGVSVLGGVEFNDCRVEDDRDRPFMMAVCNDEGQYAARISGTLTVNSPGGTAMDLGADARDITLEVTAGQ